MKLAAVIAAEFLIEDFLGLLDFGDILADTRSDQPVLQPAIRPFNLSFGLGGQGIGHFHLTVVEDLFPLGVGFIGGEVMVSPEGVPSLDEAEDGVRIHVVGVGQSVTKKDRLESLDMSPASFFFEQDGIKDESAVIIQGCDEIPFFLSGGGPEVIGGIMLNQFSGVMS